MYSVVNTLCIFVGEPLKLTYIKCIYQYLIAMKCIRFENICTKFIFMNLGLLINYNSLKLREMKEKKVKRKKKEKNNIVHYRFITEFSLYFSGNKSHQGAHRHNFRYIWL